MSDMNLVLRISSTGQVETAQGVDNVRKRVSDLGTDIEVVGSRSAGLLTGLKGLALQLAGAFTVKEFVQTADEMSLLDARLKNATASEREYATAKAEVYRIAQANNIGIKEATELYVKLSDPVKRLGGTTKEVGAITDAFAMSLRVGGASSAEAASATMQFAQAMGKGRLNGDELNTMAEASPRFMKALAEGMGVPIGTLKDMGAEGKLTSEVVGNALLKSVTALRNEAAKIPDTVGGAFTRMANDAKLAIDEVNKASGMTTGLAKIIGEAGKLIPLVRDELVEGFRSAAAFVENNREELAAVWEQAKALTSEVWDLVKGVIEVAASVEGVALKSGFVVTAWETARLLVAGFADGVRFLGGALAGIGSLILQGIAAPITSVMETVARFVNVFNEGAALKLRQLASDITGFAKAGADYAADTFSGFAQGDSKVQALNRTMAEGKAKNDQLKAALAGSSLSAAENSREMDRLAKAGGGATDAYTKLKGATDDNSKEQEKAAKAAEKTRLAYTT